MEAAENRSRDDAVECVAQDDTLLELFPDARSEIIERAGDRRTVRSLYNTLGREGTATFHFDFLLDGGVRFEKVCDGRIWRRLVGAVSFQERGSGTRVVVELEGQTQSFVPEFTIKGVMRDQLEQMASALRKRIESA